MGSGPLEDPRLQAVEAALDHGLLDHAQRLLAAFPPTPLHRQGLSYLTTRLLFQRGKLSVREVSSRMHQVLNSIHDFPQARALLAAAEGGTLSPESLAADSGRPTNLAIPGPPALPTFPGPEPELPSPTMTNADDDFDTDPLLGNDLFDVEPPTLPELPLTVAYEARGPRSASPLAPLTLSGEDFVLEPSTRPASPRRGSTDTEDLDGSDAVTLQVPRPPERAPAEAPTMFSVLTLLDERRYDEALHRIGESHSATTPELTLMRARAYLGLGRNEAACDALEPLCQSTSIGPELRAGCARLLIEAEEPLIGLDQAEMALRLAPESPAVQIGRAHV